jgi:hypothetical protein
MLITITNPYFTEVGTTVDARADVLSEGDVYLVAALTVASDGIEHDVTLIPGEYRVSMVKPYVSPLGSDLRAGMFHNPTADGERDEHDRAVAVDARDRLAARYSDLITAWARTKQEPAAMQDTRRRYFLAAFLVNDGSV